MKHHWKTSAGGKVELAVPHGDAFSQELAVLKVPDGTLSTPLGQAQRNPYLWAELL